MLLRCRNIHIFDLVGQLFKACHIPEKHIAAAGRQTAGIKVNFHVERYL
jgi:hypothetical protein